MRKFKEEYIVVNETPHVVGNIHNRFSPERMSSEYYLNAIGGHIL